MSTQKDITGLTVAAATNQLLHIGDTSGVEATAHNVCDGDGTETSLWVSTAGMGIGITPLTVLHAYGADPILRVGDSSATTDQEVVASISFQEKTSTVVGQLGFLSDSDDELTLGTNYTNGYITIQIDAATEAVRVTADGDVGIGETSPDARLHVTDSAATLLKLENSNTGSYSILSNALWTQGGGHTVKITFTQTTTAHGLLYVQCVAANEWALISYYQDASGDPVVESIGATGIVPASYGAGTHALKLSSLTASKEYIVYVQAGTVTISDITSEA